MEIVYYPDEVLTRVSAPVEVFDEELRSMVNKMAEAMYVHHGVGIAAPQVGVSRRIIIVDPSAGETSEMLTVMVNPRVVEASKRVVSLSEGCLSIPGVSVSIERPDWIEVEYQDVMGRQHVEKLVDWDARITLHELDHLDGKVMLDAVKKATRSLLLGCYKKPKKFEASVLHTKRPT